MLLLLFVFVFLFVFLLFTIQWPTSLEFGRPSKYYEQIKDIKEEKTNKQREWSQRLVKHATLRQAEIAASCSWEENLFVLNDFQRRPHKERWDVHTNIFYLKIFFQRAMLVSLIVFYCYKQQWGVYVIRDSKDKTNQRKASKHSHVAVITYWQSNYQKCAEVFSRC